MAATTCEAVGTYALGLLHWYTQPCETDRSQCNTQDYSYDTCECAENSLTKSATTFCQDGCVYSFGDNYNLVRAFSVAATETNLMVGSLPTPSLTHLIGYVNMLYKGDQYLGKISVDFAPDVLGGRQNDPVLGGPYHASFNDQACEISQIWCDQAQTDYNFYIDCSTLPGGAIVNMCDGGPLSEQSSVMELALLGPLYSCWLPAFLPMDMGDSMGSDNPIGGGLDGPSVPGSLTGGSMGGAPTGLDGNPIATGPGSLPSATATSSSSFAGATPDFTGATPEFSGAIMATSNSNW
eukprot:CAMPEP_0116133744 /NCGR_PEP_ID=MMETSP0329-20121206/10270_1 /TAXON_ID=697910 /ORGANISM="Pseudo-nitzschia arenysensis, Strain B593" /LENGTH=293 /DNA_ID=CAMNT_0003628397 /DNA_START=121 /DNA_END=999 /DNA_ORIENTATION=-